MHHRKYFVGKERKTKLIHISTTIEPEEGEEFQVSSISFMRKKEEKNKKDEYKYTYGGWFKEKSGESHYFTNYIYAKRSDNILKIISKICLDALSNEISD